MLNNIINYLRIKMYYFFALLYACYNRDFTKLEKYYLLSITDDPETLYNVGQFYESIHNFEKMEEFYRYGANKGNIKCIKKLQNKKYR